MSSGFADAMAALGPWHPDRRVAVAVSGGPDSLCLAWLTAGWGRPFGIVVDHGLRDESGVEARQAVRRLAGFGVPSRVMTVRVPSGPGLAARARAMRYRALTEAAVQEGLCDLLLGHHADDQAETVLMRRAAGSGAGGLAGMAAIVETPALRLVRPLLGASARSLRDVLRAQGIGWTEDPGNADPAATRARARALLGRREEVAGELLGLAAEAGRGRAERERAVALLMAERVALFPQGYALLSPGAVPPDMLATLLRMLGGAEYAAGSAALARLAAEPGPATLGGVRLMPAGRLGPGLLLVREPAAMAPPVQAAPGAMWDGRFVLRAQAPLPAGTSLGALGEDAPGAREAGLPSAVLRGLPALRAPGGGMAVPYLGRFSGRFCGWTNETVGLTFLPSNPAAGAPFRATGQGGCKGGAEPAPAPHVLGDAKPARHG